MNDYVDVRHPLYQTPSSGGQAPADAPSADGSTASGATSQIGSQIFSLLVQSLLRAGKAGLQGAPKEQRRPGMPSRVETPQMVSAGPQDTERVELYPEAVNSAARRLRG